jgi:hypothetical protein
MAQATFPEIPNTASFDLLYTSNDGVAIVNCQNRLWMHKDTGWSISELQDKAEDLRQAWAAEIAPIVQVEYELVQIKAKNWNNVNNPVVEWDFAAVPGTLGGDPIPFTSCAIVRFQTEGTGPSSCYIRHGGIVESQVDGQHLGTAAVTSIHDGWEALSASWSALGFQHSCVQVYAPNVAPEDPNKFLDQGTEEEVTAFVVRRRLGRSVSRQS